MAVEKRHKKTKKKKSVERNRPISHDKPVVSEGDFAAADNGQSGNRVFVSMAKTINLGNYESMRVEYGFGRVVNKGEIFKEVRDACHADVIESLYDMVRIIEKQLKGKH